MAKRQVPAKQAKPAQGKSPQGAWTPKGVLPAQGAEVIGEWTPQEVLDFVRQQARSDPGFTLFQANTTVASEEVAFTDGVAPSSSPTPTVTAQADYLYVYWTAVTNADAVGYQVHLSTSTGFTPSGGTLLGYSTSTEFIISKTVAGAALTPNTTYYVKLIAFDDDGSAAAGSQGSATFTGLSVVGLTPLRSRLYIAASTSEIIKTRNFDETQASAASIIAGIGNGATRYTAIWWPGGVCTGMYWMPNGVGNYTDTVPRSGTALYTSDGTTLTRVAELNTKLTDAVGITKRTWSSPTSSLAPQVLYVAFRYRQSAEVTAPTWSGISAQDNSANGADTDHAATPNNWPLIFAQTDNTQKLPSTQAISGLTQTAVSLPWVALY